MSVNKDIERVSLMINGMIKDTLEYKEYIKNKCLLDENEKLSSLRVNLVSVPVSTNVLSKKSSFIFFSLPIYLVFTLFSFNLFTSSIFFDSLK